MAASQHTAHDLIKPKVNKKKKSVFPTSPSRNSNITNFKAQKIIIIKHQQQQQQKKNNTKGKMKEMVKKLLFDISQVLSLELFTSSLNVATDVNENHKVEQELCWELAALHFYFCNIIRSIAKIHPSELNLANSQPQNRNFVNINWFNDTFQLSKWPPLIQINFFNQSDSKINQIHWKFTISFNVDFISYYISFISCYIIIS